MTEFNLSGNIFAQGGKHRAEINFSNYKIIDSNISELGGSYGSVFTKSLKQVTKMLKQLGNAFCRPLDHTLLSVA